jgi:RTX calcium-binding nonapeptide repeat (4 copies)
MALAGLLVGPSSAGAATQIGETFPGADGNCDTGSVLQSRSPGSPPQYAAPSDGVITAWSFQPSPVPPTLVKLKVGRPAGGNRFTIVGESAPKNPPGGILSTYTDVGIPVARGDVIGFYVESASDDAECFRSAPGFDFHYGLDQPTGTTSDYTPADLSSQISLSAVLEPDCDKDGLGDESQDTDISSCLCKGRTPGIIGTNGPDELLGTPAADVILGLGGNDKLSGLAGNDLICGGGGKDTLNGGKGNDKLYGQGGKDKLKGGPGKDKLKGGAGKDKQVQ